MGIGCVWPDNTACSPPFQPGQIQAYSFASINNTTTRLLIRSACMETSASSPVSSFSLIGTQISRDHSSKGSESRGCNKERATVP
jgi:hypothetical protein